MQTTDDRPSQLYLQAVVLHAAVSYCHRMYTFRDQLQLQQLCHISLVKDWGPAGNDMVVSTYFVR